ncbi:MAG: hypothetical protein ACE5LU_27955 [Anaerolineae bacterium]
MSPPRAVAFLLLAGVVALVVGLTPTARPALAVHLCDNWPGAFDIDAYEAQASGSLGWKNVYARSMEFAAFNQLVPDIPSFRLPQMETGPRSDGSSNLVDPYIPPVILKAIGWIESGTAKGWTQACPSVPHGSVGPVLVSHDFGYGIMQITSGMGGGTTAVPSLDQVMIGGHYGFNIARGAQILLDKWNAAPELRPIVGSRLTDRVESWYYAVWNYNGFAFKNHPLNPVYDPLRAPYRCDGTQSRANYPYQELVFGCIKSPPVVGGVRLWNPVTASLPDLNDPAFSGPLSLANWDACASNFDCAAMDIPIPTPTHIDVTTVSGSRSQAIGAPNLSVATSFAVNTFPGELSDPVTVTIRNTGTGPLVWRLSRSVTWIKLSPTQGVALGTDIGSQPSTFTFFVDARNLAIGTHSGQIRVESRMPNVSKIITVNVVVGHRSVVPGVSRN